MKNLKEFSKKFIFVVAVVWIAGAIYGGLFLIAQLVCSMLHPEAGITVDTASYFSYLSDPLSLGVISYMLKSAFENNPKYRRDTVEEPIFDAEISCEDECEVNPMEETINE